MKAAFVIAAAVGLVAAQDDASTLPECAQNCLNQALTQVGCPDAACACEPDNADAISASVLSCVSTNACPADDISALTAYSESSCSGVDTGSDGAEDDTTGTEGDATATEDAATETAGNDAAEPTESAATETGGDATDGDEATDDGTEETGEDAGTEEGDDTDGEGEADNTDDSAGSASPTGGVAGNGTTSDPIDVSGAKKGPFVGFAALIAGLLMAV